MKNGKDKYADNDSTPIKQGLKIVEWPGDEEIVFNSENYDIMSRKEQRLTNNIMLPNEKITKDFSFSEFIHAGYHVSDEGVVVYPGEFQDIPLEDWIDIQENIKALANRLQVIRDFYSRPIKINSGYRTPEHNRAVGGAVKSANGKGSYHLKGMAADIEIWGYPAHKVWFDWKDRWSGGLGVYDTFVHFDLRPTRARWDKRTRTMRA